MNSANAVYKQVLAPQASSSGGGTPSAAVIDTAGYAYLELLAELGAGSSGTAIAALSLSESDSSGMASSTQVPGCVTGVSSQLAAPSSGGMPFPETQQYTTTSLPTQNTINVMNVDLKGRKRYMQPTLTPGTSIVTQVSMVARLSRAEIAPHLAAQVVPSGGVLLTCPPYSPTSCGL